MALNIVQQPNNMLWDPYVGAYNNIFIVANSNNATQIGFKYKVDIVTTYNNIDFSTTTIKQPPQPDGLLVINAAEYLRPLLNESDPVNNGQSFDPFSAHMNNTLIHGAVRFKVVITEEVNGVLQGSPVETRNAIAYFGTANEIETPFDTESFVWAVEGDPGAGTNNPQCPVPDMYYLNQPLITWQPNVITKAQDPTMPFDTPSFISITRVTMPRIDGLYIPMYIQKNSELPAATWVNQWVYPAFSVLHRYYNGNTLVYTDAYILDSCGDSKVLSNDTNIQFVAPNSFESISYRYKSSAAGYTHVWITAHPYSDPDVCRGGVNTPALDCNSKESIIAYSEPKPLAAYRIDFEDSCDYQYELNGDGRTKWGQLIFLNKAGTWDTLFLNQVKTEHSIKKSTWRNTPNLPPNTGQWGKDLPSTKQVHVNQVDTTTMFSCKTDYMLDNTEEFMKQLYKSPAVYLITAVPKDYQFPYGSGGNYAPETFRVVIESTSFKVKRRQTDNLFQYTIDCVADLKPRTQRT